MLELEVRCRAFKDGHDRVRDGLGSPILVVPVGLEKVRSDRRGGEAGFAVVTSPRFVGPRDVSNAVQHRDSPALHIESRPAWLRLRHVISVRSLWRHSPLKMKGTTRRLRGAFGGDRLCDLTDRTTERAQRHPAEKRARLLAAARTLFAQIGYGASVHQICRAAGVGIGTFYNQFPDKADLMRHLMSQEHDFRVRAFDAIAADRTDNVGEIARVLAGSDPALLRAMIEACGIDAELRDFGRGLRKETLDRLAAALGRARQAREIRRPALDASTAAWAALVIGDAGVDPTGTP